MDQVLRFSCYLCSKVVFGLVVLVYSVLQLRETALQPLQGHR